MRKFSVALLGMMFFSVMFATHSQAEDIVATVNGKKITQQELDKYFKYRQATTKQDIGEPKDVLQELINRELMLMEAKKKKIDKNQELNYAIEQQKHDIYIQALIRETDIAKPIPQEEVQKIYDERIKSQKLKEYKLSHILLKTEQDAKTAIAELDAGAVFKDVAKSKSQGPSADNGGDLGWLNPGQLNSMPGFAQAVSEMQKGSYSKTPVHTQYGWHVIHLEDVRDLEPPALDQVEKQITNALRQQRLQEYVMQLRKAAKIDIKLK